MDTHRSSLAPWLRHYFTICSLAAAFVVASTNGISAQPRPLLVKSTDFVLTEEQAAAGIDGSVRISVDVDKKGLVTDAEILAGPIWPCDNSAKDHLAAFRAAAIKNAKTFIFEPASENGKPVKSNTVLLATVGPHFSETQRAKLEPPARTMVIDGGVVNDRAVKIVKPRLPTVAKVYATAVLVQVLIGEDGKVLSAGGLYGPTDYHKVSRDAACESVFSPTLEDGKPVKVAGFIRYSFVYAPTSPEPPRIGRQLR